MEGGDRRHRDGQEDHGVLSGQGTQAARGRTPQDQDRGLQELHHSCQGLRRNRMILTGTQCRHLPIIFVSVCTTGFTMLDNRFSVLLYLESESGLELSP